MLVALLAGTLALLFAGLTLPRLWVAPPAFWAHLVLAVGIMTLITAAMQHFTPVLTRSRGTGPWVGRLPWLMTASGGLATAALLGVLPWGALLPAALLGLLGSLAMWAWMAHKARRALGGAHPGLAWYVAAMACLAAGLVAAALMPLFPAWYGPLKAFHLHINLYGFVGLTAVGTLQVLMPTVLDSPDAAAGQRLRRDLPWAVAGSIALALGMAAAEAPWGTPLAWLGAAAWGWALGRMVWAWLRLYPRQVLAVHGAAPILLAAVIGFASAMLASLGLASLSSPLSVFLPAFLFPLVSGAAAQLAPVWMTPGRNTPWHDASRTLLGRWGGVRAVLFASAAILPLLGYKCAGMPGLTALLWFLVLFVIWLLRD